MTFNLTLKNFLLEDFKTKSMFGGVLPVDRLPQYPLRRKPRIFIINTDDSTGPGKHWVLVYFSANWKGVYFDSYGFDVMDPRIEHFLMKNCFSYVYNSKCVQGALSHTCGYFCLYVAKRLARGYTLKRIVRDFRTFNTYYNDTLVVSRFKKKSIYLPS